MAVKSGDITKNFDESASMGLDKKKKYLFFKQVADISVSILLSPVLIIIVFIAGIVIKMDSKGPIIYSQQRVGKNGNVFTIYKLRSMRTDAEKHTGAVWAEKDDPRITRVGKVLRKFRIDELPQFLNIITGDMSLIGPRPEREDLTDLFENEIPGFKDRLLVKPGITGLAQVNGGYNISPKEKLIYDREYIINIGIKEDIKILFKTVGVIFTGHGSR